jgi:hypothetical protein
VSNEWPKDDPTGEPNAATGVFAAFDAEQTRALETTSATAANAKPEAAGEDPYNRTIPPLLDDSAKPQRRSLDDMRRLSEMIKAGRSGK